MWAGAGSWVLEEEEEVWVPLEISPKPESPGKLHPASPSSQGAGLVCVCVYV